MDESTDHLRDTFRATGRRLTSQRRLILGVLEESDVHLDAETLFVRAKTRDPDISLATVYRTLAVLKEMGLVEEHSLGEEHRLRHQAWSAAAQMQAEIESLSESANAGDIYARLA